MDGGGTAFPYVGRIVFPTKGSVVFWYNLNRDGTKQEYSFHGGCPTMYGIKYGKYKDPNIDCKSENIYICNNCGLNNLPIMCILTSYLK